MKSRKKYFAILLCAALAAGSLAGCGGNKTAASSAAPQPASSAQSSEAPASSETKTAEGEKIIMRLAETQTETYPATMGAIEFARLVGEKSGGRIQIDVFTGGQLGGDEKAVLEQVQFGAIDFTRANLSPVTEFEPMINLLNLPYLFRDVDHMHKVIDSDVGKTILNSVESADFVGLALYDAGSRNFYNNKKPITKLADMKGLKFRVPQSQMMMDLVEALGGDPTPIAFGEVYSALQTGVIDGAENNWVSYDQNSHYEVAKYITLDAHTAPPEILVASKMTMEKLSPEDQQLIKECAKESELWERGQYDKVEQASRDKTVAAGAQVSELENRDEFVQAVQPLYDKFAGDYKDLLDQIVNTK